MVSLKPIRPKLVRPFNIYADQDAWMRNHQSREYSAAISELIDLHIIPLEIDEEDVKNVNNIVFLNTEDLKTLKNGTELHPRMAVKLVQLCAERDIYITAHQAVPVIERWWRLFQ